MTASRELSIVLLTAVGGTVHVLPVVNSLKRHDPSVRITWVIQPGPHGLVAGHPAVDEFVVFDRARGWRAFADVRRAVRGRRFDVVLGLQDYLKAGILTRLIPARRRVGFDARRARDLNWLFTGERLRPRPRGHVQDEYLEFLEHLGVPVRLEWGLEPSLEERARYAAALPDSARRTAAFVVGTSRAEKEWPAERYAAVVDGLAEMGVRSVLVGGRSPREDAASATIRARAAHPPLDLREWDLRKVVYLIAEADVLVAPDTGPMHAGVALGTPTVALMGCTNPKRCGPYRRFHDLMVDAYGDPGEDYAASTRRREGRMERITPEMVLAKARLALERYPRLAVSAGVRGQAAP